ncbi:unnamed protein product, partial [Mesorhabditis belari]|uniref:Uncharacterized protein n=1 Tax=Mesorhabditis belari TaxID=2138241 RepID=A0AAF3EEX3_9BILA
MDPKETLLNEKIGKERDSLDVNDSEVAEENEKTYWRNILLAALVNLLSTIESTIIINAQWPYLQKLDEDVSPTFMGYINSSCKAAHAIFAILFGALAFRTKKLRLFIMLGRFVTIFGCIFFVKAEKMEEYSKYLIFLSYFLFSIGDSSLMLIRGYVASVSGPNDRALAFAALAMANVLSMIFGAGSLLLFSLIDYSDFHPFGITVHMYNFPIFIIILLNILVMGLTHFGLEEHRERLKKKHQKNGESGWHQLKSVPIFLVLLCFFEKIVTSTSLTTAITITSPIATEVFAWDKSKTVQVMSGSNATIGILALITVLIFMLGKIGNKIAAWRIFLTCTLVFFAFFFLVYPHSIISEKITMKTPDSPFGCDVSKYGWCMDTLRPSPYLYFSLLIISFGIFFPLANISLDTVYSKILGNIDQSFFQSAIVAADDLFQILCPFIITHSFVLAGHPMVFAMWAALCAVGVIAWTLNSSQLKRSTEEMENIDRFEETIQSNQEDLMENGKTMKKHLVLVNQA